MTVLPAVEIPTGTPAGKWKAARDRGGRQTSCHSRFFHLHLTGGTGPAPAKSMTTNTVPWKGLFFVYRGDKRRAFRLPSHRMKGRHHPPRTISRLDVHAWFASRFVDFRNPKRQRGIMPIPRLCVRVVILPLAAAETIEPTSRLTTGASPNRDTRGKIS